MIDKQHLPTGVKGIEFIRDNAPAHKVDAFSS